jgi:hypothetical protein
VALHVDNSLGQSFLFLRLTPIYGQECVFFPKYTAVDKKRIFCGWIVDELSRIHPQVNQAGETGIDPTSRERRGASSHIYGFSGFVHSIHSTYYYYDSHILFN